MATSSALSFDGVNVKEYDVIADADADTGIVLTHNFGAVAFVSLVGLDPAARLSQWVVTDNDPNAITLEKTTAVGSGVASAQLRVLAMVPNAKELG